MTTHRLRTISIGIAVIVIVLGAAAVLALRGTGSTHFGSPTVTVDRGDVELLITAAGKLEAAAYVDVGTQVSGQLKRLLKVEGDAVRKGEVVAEIDDTLLRAKLLEARATLDNLRAQQLAQRAELTLAEQRAARYQGLLGRDAISRSEVELAVSTLNAAQARLEALAAQIRQAEASVATAEANLGYTTIRAPISGVVVAIHAREGQTLNAIQTVPELMEIADLDTMTVVSQVSEADVSRLRVGQQAYFTILGQPERRWAGRIRQIKPAPEIINDVVFYNALFDVTNDGTLMSEMTAQVFFILDRVSDAVRVPVTALRARDGEHAQVQVMHGARTQMRAVTVRLAGEIHAAIESGLEPGDVVVLGEPGAAHAERTTALRSAASSAPPRYLRAPKDDAGGKSKAGDSRSRS